MFRYEKMLEYPINIKKKDLKMAKLLNDQLGGPNGELGACLRYLCQRFTRKKFTFRYWMWRNFSLWNDSVNDYSTNERC